MPVVFLLLPFVMNFAKSGQDQTQSGFPKFVMENGWLRVEFPWTIWELWTGSHTISVSRKIAGWGWIFHNKIGKSGQDQKQSGFPKFVMENGWLRLDFEWQIWKIWRIIHAQGFPNFLWTMAGVGPPDRKRACLPCRDLEGESHSRPHLPRCRWVVSAGSKKSRCGRERSGHCRPGPCLTQYLGWNLVNPTQSRFQCGGSHLDSVGRLALDVSWYIR